MPFSRALSHKGANAVRTFPDTSPSATALAELTVGHFLKLDQEMQVARAYVRTCPDWAFGSAINDYLRIEAELDRLAELIDDEIPCAGLDFE